MKKLYLILTSVLLVSCATKTVVGVSSVQSKDVIISDPKSNFVKILKTEDKAISLLNQLFSSDITNKNMVLVINNDSDCDFTMDVLGSKLYKIPVAAKTSESIVIEQGSYEMRSDVCDSKYSSKKQFTENTQVVIKHVNASNTHAKQSYK